jgi:hypothetical protein
MIKNKKAYSLSAWTEGILLSVLFVAVFAGVIGEMNGLYHKDYQVGLGTNSTKDDFSSYQGTIQSQITSGEAEFSADQGLTLKSSWGILKTGVSIVWNFITGGWIEEVCSYMSLPTEVGLYLRILYFLSVGFIVLWILFKVKP